MATYFVKLSNGYKGQAADKYDYINREGKYKSDTLRQELVAQEDFNLPSWAPNAKTFLKLPTAMNAITELLLNNSLLCSPANLVLKKT